MGNCLFERAGDSQYSASGFFEQTALRLFVISLVDLGFHVSLWNRAVSQFISIHARSEVEFDGLQFQFFANNADNHDDHCRVGNALRHYLHERGVLDISRQAQAWRIHVLGHHGRIARARDAVPTS